MSGPLFDLCCPTCGTRWTISYATGAQPKPHARLHCVCGTWIPEQPNKLPLFQVSA